MVGWPHCSTALLGLTHLNGGGGSCAVSGLQGSVCCLESTESRVVTVMLRLQCPLLSEECSVKSAVECLILCVQCIKESVVFLLSVHIELSLGWFVLIVQCSVKSAVS